MNACSRCGADAEAGQSFCRRCGTPLDATASQPSAGGAVTGLATAEMTGRACPYCRFPLKQDVPIAECGFCHTVHHVECWEENGGCSITGCTGGPTQATQVHGPPSPVATTPAQGRVDAGLRGPTGLPPAPRPPVPLALTITLAVAVAILGAAAALALSSGKGSSPIASVPPLATETTQTEATSTFSPSSETETTATDTEANATETEATSSEAATESASSNESQTESPLGAVNEHWHDIQTGDYQGAWADETPALGGDESSWVHGQEVAGVESVSYQFEQASRSGDEATVDIVNLQTVSRANGCQRWTGSYGLTYDGGKWQISNASSLRSQPC